jgi:hypothetical protein
VAPQNLDLYLRGEKPEISHNIVAWASQTGKGLLFFNKKNDTDRSHPHDILALYEATDLKKESPHSFSLKIGTHSHTFKATSDAERDGWYMSIEKAIELGKASKEEILAREGYTAELEKLNKPAVPAVAALSKRSQSQPKKSTEGEAAAERTGSSEGETDKKQKSRSTSRGILSRLQGKKEEHAEKKEEEKVVEETAKPETETAEPVLASTEAAPVLAGGAAAEVPVVAETCETSSETPVVAETKANKRNSIFGRVSSTWGSMKSPAKEKDLKEVELKPETPAAEAGAVSENPPVLPETGSAEPATTAVPVVAEPAVEAKPEATTDAPVDTPTKEKNNFLSSLIKRGRSVSPSTTKKTANKEEVPAVPAVPATETAEPVVKAEEPTPVAEPIVADTTEPTEKVEEPKTETNANKRQSMLGSLGRRASKALNRMQAPKKETPAAATTTETPAEEVVEAKPVEETTTATSENKATEVQPTIGDVVPEAVSAGQPQHTTPAVSASA